MPRYHVCGWDLARFSGRRSARFRSKLGIVKERFTYATSPRASQRHVSLASLRWLYRGGRANAREFRGSKNFSNQIVANRQQEQIPRGLRRLCRNQCRRSAAQSNFPLYPGLTPGANTNAAAPRLGRLMFERFIPLQIWIRSCDIVSKVREA